jgi:hypothetical protein
MKRRRSARIARPNEARAASSNSRSPGKMARRAEKSGKVRKKIKKRSAPPHPSNQKNLRSQFNQLSLQRHLALAPAAGMR